jgi:hypothetical protein
MELQEGIDLLIELQWSETKAELSVVTGRIGFSDNGVIEAPK